MLLYVGIHPYNMEIVFLLKRPQNHTRQIEFGKQKLDSDNDSLIIFSYTFK